MLAEVANDSNKLELYYEEGDADKNFLNFRQNFTVILVNFGALNDRSDSNCKLQLFAKYVWNLINFTENVSNRFHRKC